MTNIIGYNKLPDREQFIRLYEVERKSQQELSAFYGCGKLRIRRWIEKFGLTSRDKGSGKGNKRYEVTSEVLQDLVNKKFTNSEIGSILGMSRSNVARCLRSFGIKRVYNKSEYQKYAKKVRLLTESNYAKYKEVVNPDNLPRTLCGVDGGYQLDHIHGVRECFDNGISIEECAALKNLQMIPWQTNLQKRRWKGKTDESG